MRFRGLDQGLLPLGLPLTWGWYFISWRWQGRGARKAKFKGTPHRRQDSLTFLRGVGGIEALGASMLSDSNSHCPPTSTTQPQPTESAFLPHLTRSPKATTLDQAKITSPHTQLGDFSQPSTPPAPCDSSSGVSVWKLQPQQDSPCLKCFCSFQTTLVYPTRPLPSTPHRRLLVSGPPSPLHSHPSLRPAPLGAITPVFPALAQHIPVG